MREPFPQAASKGASPPPAPSLIRPITKESCNATAFHGVYYEAERSRSARADRGPFTLMGAGNAYAQAKPTTEKSLYDRLGGVFAIAAVVDHFSNAVVKNPIVGQKSKNPQLREWHTKNLKRLPGLKFMRTLWVCKRFGRALPVYGHQAWHDAARPGGGAPGSPDLPRRIR